MAPRVNVQKKWKMETCESRISAALEVRHEEGGVLLVEGYAAVFNDETIIFCKWQERIIGIAFTEDIEHDYAVVWLFMMACLWRIPEEQVAEIGREFDGMILEREKIAAQIMREERFAKALA